MKGLAKAGTRQASSLSRLRQELARGLKALRERVADTMELAAVKVAATKDRKVFAKTGPNQFCENIFKQNRIDFSRMFIYHHLPIFEDIWLRYVPAPSAPYRVLCL